MKSAIQDYGDTNFITGMRAFAAFGVVMIHAGGAGFRALGDIGNNLADLGRTGVYVFFVISGFSVASSFATSGGYFDYLNKRLWRVAPLYFFWVLLAGSTLWLPALLGGFSMRGADVYNILMHLSFLSFLDYRITNSIIGVEWSIPIEVFWYFIVPILIVAIQGKRTMFFALFGSVMFYQIVVNSPQFMPVPESDASLALHWSPIPYLLSYCLGVSAYKLRHTFEVSVRIANLVLVLVLVLVAAFVMHPSLINRIFFNEFVFISAATFALIVFGSQKSGLFRWIFASRLVIFLGVVSYGVYLSHLMMLWIITPYTQNMTLRFLLVAIAATIVSTLTYYLVERPSMALGRRFFRPATRAAQTG